MNEQLKEKIANILYDGAMQGIHPLTVAQQILDLPLLDLKCTMGEALEKVGEMVDLSLYMFDLLKRNRPWKEDDPYYEIWKMVDNALTLKDGRRIGRQE